MESTRLRTVTASAVLALAAALAIWGVVGAATAGAATGAIPIGQSMTGSMTFYNDSGFGACGTAINAATQNLVAVSFQWWTTANPNNDPLCQGISVQVTFNGKTITVPVKDKCPSCDATHIDLSQPAFAQLAPLSAGVVNGITWKFVSSGGGGGGGGGTLPAPTGLRVTGTTGTSVGLSWNAVSGATSYAVFRDGTRVASRSGTSFTDTGLAGGSTHSYSVASVNSAGTGARSAPVSATTTGGGGGGSGCKPAWNPATSYVPGNIVSYHSHNWTATYYSTGAVPDAPSSWAVWRDSGAC